MCDVSLVSWSIVVIALQKARNCSCTVLKSSAFSFMRLVLEEDEGARAVTLSSKHMNGAHMLPVSDWYWRCSLWVLSASGRKTPTGWLQPHDVEQPCWLLGRLPVDSIPSARYNTDSTLSSINSLVLYSGLRLDWKWVSSALHLTAGRSWMPWCGHTPVCGYCKCIL